MMKPWLFDHEIAVLEAIENGLTELDLIKKFVYNKIAIYDPRIVEEYVNRIFFTSEEYN